MFEHARPYAIVQADVPFELFQVMDVPAVSNQWWSALIAAKQLAPDFLEALRARGFHDGLCRYCSLGPAATLATDGPAAPWGGLPKSGATSACSWINGHDREDCDDDGDWRAGLACAVHRHAGIDDGTADVQSRILGPAAAHSARVRDELSQLGLFTGMYGLLAIVMSVPAGLLARQVGEKRALIGGLTVVAGGLVVLGRAQGFGEAMWFRGLWIAGYRMAFVCVLTALAMTAPPALKGRSMGLLGATSAMASVIGAPIGGWVGRDFGWRTGVLWYAGAAVPGAAVIAAFYRRTTPDTGADDPHGLRTPGATTASPSAFRTPIVWILACLPGIGGVGQFSVTAFVPSVARSVFGLDTAAAGLIISTG